MCSYNQAGYWQKATPPLLRRKVVLKPAQNAAQSFRSLVKPRTAKQLKQHSLLLLAFYTGCLARVARPGILSHFGIMTIPKHMIYLLFMKVRMCCRFPVIFVPSWKPTTNSKPQMIAQIPLGKIVARLS